MPLQPVDRDSGVNAPRLQDSVLGNEAQRTHLTAVTDGHADIDHSAEPDGHATPEVRDR